MVFRCEDCGYGSDVLSNVVNHYVIKHQKSIIRVKETTLSEKSGHFQSKILDFGVRSSDVRKEFDIHTNDDARTIKLCPVLNDSFPLRPAKKKCLSPTSTKDASVQTEGLSFLQHLSDIQHMPCYKHIIKLIELLATGRLPENNIAF